MCYINFFFLNWLIFLLPTDLERNSQLSKIVRKKEKLKKEQLEMGIRAISVLVFRILNWCQSIWH